MTGKGMGNPQKLTFLVRLMEWGLKIAWDCRLRLVLTAYRIQQSRLCISTGGGGGGGDRFQDSLGYQTLNLKVPYIKWPSTVGALNPWVPHPGFHQPCTDFALNWSVVGGIRGCGTYGWKVGSGNCNVGAERGEQKGQRVPFPHFVLIPSDSVQNMLP